MTSPNLLHVKDKVQKFTTQFFDSVELVDNGDLSVPFDSTNIFISCSEADQTDPELNEFLKEHEISTTMVTVWALVLSEVKGTPELFKWIATEGQTSDFGRFKAIEMLDSPGKYVVSFEHTLAGDTLSAGELKGTLAGVSFVANEEDDNLKARFGGKMAEDLRQS